MRKYERELGDADSPNHGYRPNEDGSVTLWDDCQSVRLSREQQVTLVTQLIKDGLIRIKDIPTPYHCGSCDGDVCDDTTAEEEDEADAARKPYRYEPGDDA